MSPTVGGCAFAHDPDLPAGEEPGIWLPEVSPGTLILEPAPSGFTATAVIDLGVLGEIVDDRSDADGREVAINDGSGELHVRLPSDDATRRPAVLLPVDAVFDIRLDVASRFVRRLRGTPVKLLPTALRLTWLQRMRLIQLLHTFDVREAGGGPREVADLVLASKQAALPSVEWKDSAARRKAIRLIRDSVALVERNYLKLLSGR